MSTEVFYIGHDNTVDLQLLVDGVAVPASEMLGITKITVTIDGETFESSDPITGIITWAQAGYEDGEIRIGIGNEADLDPSNTALKAWVVCYSADWPNGLVWGFFLAKVMDEVEES